MTKPKVVFDTNIYISAIIFGGRPRKVLNLAISEEIILFTSPAILLEIALKFKNKFSWSNQDVSKAIKAINDIAEIVKPKKHLKFIKKDPTDDKIIEAAVAAKAEFIITGDSHLLDIKKHKNINILTTKSFLKIFEKKRNN